MRVEAIASAQQYLGTHEVLAALWTGAPLPFLRGSGVVMRDYVPRLQECVVLKQETAEAA
jgi:hypothetical protein